VRTLAIVPIKSFANAKQRLAKVLASGSRQSLVQAMFSDVLGGLRRMEGLEAIAVVTDDVSAESLSRGDRMVVLPDDSRSGQSEATEIGIGYAQAHGYERVLLVPGDTPLLDPPEVEDLLMRCDRDAIEVGIVADRHGTGTNALVIRPPGAFSPAFGPGSLERHVERARESGLSHRIERVPSLEHDVDTPADLAALWTLIDDSRRGAQRTRGALSQLERSGARAAIYGAQPRSGLTVEA
jgi:2-phospho-L-lactate guanylyltransferase